MAWITAGGSMISVKIESRWIGLHWPHTRRSWIQNDVVVTVTIRATQSQPMVRWGNVPFGAASCTAPRANAALAANACTWVDRGAASSGARDTGHSPDELWRRMLSLDSSVIMARWCAPLRL